MSVGGGGTYGTIDADVVRAETIQSQIRTSDPSNPSVGDWWVREDIEPSVENANTVGQLRVQGGGGVLEVPLIDGNDESALGEDIYPGKRFAWDTEVDSNVYARVEGFIPVTDQGGAVGSPRHQVGDGTVYQSHNDTVLSTIPDGTVLQYKFENDTDTTAIDSVNNNDGTLNGGTYSSSTVKKGSFSYYNQSDGNYVASNSSFDLASNGNTDEVSIGSWIYDDSISTYCGPFYNNGSSDYFGVRENNGWEAILKIGGNSATASTGITPSSRWDHVFAVCDSSELICYVNGTAEATSSHSLDPSTIGSQTVEVGRLASGVTGGTAYFDDVTAANVKYSSDGISAVKDR